MKTKTKITLLLIAGTLLGLIPSLKYSKYLYDTHTIVGSLLIVISTILLYIALDKPYRIIAIILLFIYSNNIALTFSVAKNIIDKGYITKTNTDDNDTCKQMVINIFRHHFDLRIDFSLMDTSKPCIYISNYIYDRIEHLACVLVPGNTVIMMRKVLKKVWNAVKWIIEVDSKGSFQYCKKQIEEHTSHGRSIFSYTAHKKNGLRHDYINNVRKGIFHIAKDLNIPVTFVAIDSIEKGPLDIIPYQKFQIKSSETFYVDDVNEAAHKARIFLRNTLKEFKRTKFIFDDIL